MKKTTTPEINIEEIRKQFPILKKKVHGKPLVYLDNAATSQKPKAVINAITEFYEKHNANVNRGVHQLAEESTQIYEEARETVARFFNTQTKNVVFTSGTTDSLNFVANWFVSKLKKNDEIILSTMEHHANLVVWQEVAKKTGAKIVYLPLEKDFSFNTKKLKQTINTNTKLIALPHISNVLGTVTPLKEVVKLAQKHNIYTVIDGAQAVGHTTIDMKHAQPDFYAFSAHKIYGPMGIGGLIIHRRMMDQLTPYRFGGDMIAEVTKKRTTYAEAPHCFEAGTPNVAGAHALSTAINFIETIGLQNISKHEEELIDYTKKELKKMPQVKIYLAPKPRGSVISFDIEGVHPHDVAQILNQEGVAIRSGMHCAMPLHQELGVPALNRASVAIYNKKEDIDQFIKAIHKAIEIFS